MKWVVAATFILCAPSVWANGTPECTAFLAVSNSYFDTVTVKPTQYTVTELPQQVGAIMRPYIENPENDPASGNKTPEYVNGFHVDLNGDGNNEYVLEVQRFRGTSGRFYVFLSEFDGEWKEVATLQGAFHLSASSNQTPLITFHSRGGSEVYLRQEYFMQNGRLELLRSQRFRHGVITEEIVEKTETNRVEQAGPGYPPQGVGSPDP
jgi:hypothetical protein